ncbi:signal peptidase II [Photobacterium alginatilyticum]|uniref:signal peptidase II n=1 Tax=Photobacterium alginatilyticum TaxID=1775171 RepID=UPI0040675F1E
MDICKRIQVVFWVTLSCIGVDQATKVLASQELSNNVMTSYFSDLLRVGYTENIGAFLGLGNTLSDNYRFGFFVIAVGTFLFGLLAYIVISSKQNLPSLIALSLVFSGGFSNFYDRVTNNGAVIDFLNVGIGSVRTGVFNVADVAIMVGVLMLLLSHNSLKIQRASL